MHLNDTIEHNGRYAHIVALQDGRVTIQRQDGRLQSGSVDAMWMFTHVACAVE
jgi:hypothetical protein